MRLVTKPWRREVRTVGNVCLMLLPLLAVLASACGGEGTGTTTRQPVTTATRQPTATVRAEPSVGTRLSAVSADGSVEFEILVTSESTFELPSVVVKIDPELSCDPETTLRPMKVTLSPSEVGAISEGELEFRGSQAISIVSQDLDFDLITMVSTLEGSDGLSINGRFTAAERAQGVLRFTGGPVLSARFVPSGGGPAEDVTLTCDTGEIAWTAQASPHTEGTFTGEVIAGPCEPGDEYESAGPDLAVCKDLDRDSGVQCETGTPPFRVLPAEDYVCFYSPELAAESGECEPGDRYLPPDEGGYASCLDVDGDSGVRCEGNNIPFRVLPSQEYVCTYSPELGPGGVGVPEFIPLTGCAPGETVAHDGTSYRCVEEGSLQDRQPCFEPGQHYVMPSGQTFICGTTGPSLPP